jgi:CxxC motif-containing protein
MSYELKFLVKSRLSAKTRQTVLLINNVTLAKEVAVLAIESHLRIGHIVIQRTMSYGNSVVPLLAVNFSRRH